MSFTLKLREGAIDQLMADQGIKTKGELAHKLGIPRSTFTRIQATQTPTASFIAGVKACFGEQENLYDIVPAAAEKVPA